MVPRWYRCCEPVLSFVSPPVARSAQRPARASSKTAPAGPSVTLRCPNTLCTAQAEDMSGGRGPQRPGGFFQRGSLFSEFAADPFFAGFGGFFQEPWSSGARQVGTNLPWPAWHSFRDSPAHPLGLDASTNRHETMSGALQGGVCGTIAAVAAAGAASRVHAPLIFPCSSSSSNVVAVG